MVVNCSHRHRPQRAALRAFYARTKHIPQWERECASRLADIGHPTLVLWGTHDKVFPLSVRQAMQRTIPNSEFVVVPNAGHVPQ
ncbi:MAG: alpha/beta fold hydrolase [Nitrospira sp.]|nr:alpha/beta fold hydrolase [Nitrospira sp.]